MSGWVGDGQEEEWQSSVSAEPWSRFSGMSPVEVCNKEWNLAKEKPGLCFCSCKVTSKPLDALPQKSVSAYLDALGHHPTESNSINYGDLPCVTRVSAGLSEQLETEISHMVSHPCLYDGTSIKTLDSRLRWASLVGSLPCVLSHLVSGRFSTVYDSKGQDHWKCLVWNFPGSKISWHTCQASWTRPACR